MTAIAHFDDHDVVALSRWLEADLAAAIERPMWTMSTNDAEEALLSLTRARGQLDALLMHVLRQAEAVGAGIDRHRLLRRGVLQPARCRPDAAPACGANLPRPRSRPATR